MNWAMAAAKVGALHSLGSGIPLSWGLAIAPNAWLSHRPSFPAGTVGTVPCTGEHEGRRRLNQGELWAAPLQSVHAFRRMGASNWEHGDTAKLVQSFEDSRAEGRETEQQERRIGRRQALATTLPLCSVPIVFGEMPGKLLAAEEAKKEAENNDQSVLGGLLSLFDPNETTKQGKKLPKAYLKSARDVVETLRASFSEDSQNDAKFRRNADSAKGAIREYISSWRGAKLVDAEDSYQALERVLRGLSEFYSKKGPSAALPEDVRARILEDLQKADDAL